MIQTLAEKRGGQCLSHDYVNVNLPLSWKCNNQNHPAWAMPANNIIKGSWCPYCRKDLFVNPLKKRIAENKGEWISGDYVNSYTKILIKCENNHQWYATPSSIINGHWCCQCAHNRNKEKTKNVLFALVAQKGGEVLSKNYNGSLCKVRVKCHSGHIFITTQSKIQQGHWCSECAIKNRRGNINEIIVIARERGGECLSMDYQGAHEKLKFRCNKGHTWHAKPNAIKNGTWCPECNNYLGENLVRQLLEKTYQKPFPKSYPIWLKSKEGTQLELDGYNKELKTAFEHQGIQHIERKGRFAKGFERRRMLDHVKRQLCAKNGIKLIEIFQAGEKRSVDEIKVDLEKECQRLEIILPVKLSDIEINKNAAFAQIGNDHFKVVKAIAQSKGGKCLSNIYCGHYSKLEFECSKKHKWFTDPATIKRGRWCPTCAKQNNSGRKLKYNLSDMIALAKNKGGKCLSIAFINVTTKLKWECKNGHQWLAVPSSIIRGSWCKSCAATERNLRRYNK